MFFNYDKPGLIKGWAIPIATDTTFVLGILSFFSRHISLELRTFIIGFSRCFCVNYTSLVLY
ncbi:na+/H+ antiporter 1 family protein [Rickettsia amblyommatis str. Darkwater]|nr:na+/H+ antiporter 1 family protein [Rickettsia amblyommatis str. Darkwater]